ncbi:MAG: peptidylprolyl isomerase [Gammaproteobacteria bacterium]|nr:peptidylprolyl isomerase [Gammaproteobacteria bacterium]
MKKIRNLLCAIVAALAMSGVSQDNVETEGEEVTDEPKENPKVLFDTTHGTIMMELFEKDAPITVKHFLALVDDGHYDGIIFHRAHRNFVIQAGSFDQDMNSRDIPDTIKNEASNGLSNVKGSVAMARGDHPDSAAADFFINTKDNRFLDYSKSKSEDGYAVFGKVTRGMDVVHAIEKLKVKTEEVGGVKLENVPVEKVVIISAQRYRDK